METDHGESSKECKNVKSVHLQSQTPNGSRNPNMCIYLDVHAALWDASIGACQPHPISVHISPVNSKQKQVITPESTPPPYACSGLIYLCNSRECRITCGGLSCTITRLDRETTKSIMQHMEVWPTTYVQIRFSCNNK